MKRIRENGIHSGVERIDQQCDMNVSESHHKQANGDGVRQRQRRRDAIMRSICQIIPASSPSMNTTVCKPNKAAMERPTSFASALIKLCNIMLARETTRYYQMYGWMFERLGK